MSGQYIWKKRKRCAALAMLAVCLLLLAGCGQRVKTTNCHFTESPKALDNPGRGFYYIYTFQITDEKEDYHQIITEKYAADQETRLSLVEINLQDYRNGAITEAGLSNIDALLSALEATDKQLILRFLYDWDGKNEDTEPEQLDTVLMHMEQVGPVLREHQNQIFTLQGLFIGNWGELNGSKFLADEDLYLLASTLANATDESTYLSVRTPAQWRKIVESADLKEKQLAEELNVRLGLFNDGMLGNEYDYGTYGVEDGEDAGWDSGWSRADELDFQDELCSRVPNGGEVIHENDFNDLPQAVEALSAMHVTYLNRDYDRQVLDKWAEENVSEKSCFSGMDGLTYMERHLGYRLLITEAQLDYIDSKERVYADIAFQNVGFAPLYRDVNVEMTLYSEEKDERLVYEVPQNLRKLEGGTRSEELLTIRSEVPVNDLSETKYNVYVSITDSQTGEEIFLGNKQEADEYGYQIGTVTVY